MNRTRGRPAQGNGLNRADILTAALSILDESGGQGLTMRNLALRLGVSPMSLYRHVGSHSELLRVLSDLVYATVLEYKEPNIDPATEIRGILIRYHRTICSHPQLTLAIFTAPEAMDGVTRRITDRLNLLLTGLAVEPEVWRDILIDHAHGSGLACALAGEGPIRVLANSQYLRAMDQMLEKLIGYNAT